MANELPYFRFTVQAWQNGKIDIERYELKGFFIDLCGYYWVQDCEITLTLLKKKFKNDHNLIDELIESEIIKHEKRHDKIEIEFLNNQYDLLSEKRKTRQAAGSKGGNAKAMLKQKGSYKDKDKENNKDKEKDNNKDKEKDNNKDKIRLPFETENFKAKWAIWIAYKKDIKKPYKTLKGQQMQLIELSKFTEEIACAMIDQSIRQEWQGIFELKNNIQNGKQQTSDQRKSSVNNLVNVAIRNLTDNAGQYNAGGNSG